MPAYHRLSGRDWTYRGNQLLRNTWKDIGHSIFSSVMTIYLDDMVRRARFVFAAWCTKKTSNFAVLCSALLSENLWKHV